MKQILQNLNYSLNDYKSNGRKLSLLIVSNPDGSPRWIMNAEAKKAYFLKFYSVNNLRSLIYSMVIKALFLLRVQKLFFKVQEFQVAESTGDRNLAFDLFQANWALFTGTPGPNNKYILYKKNKTEASFHKIAISLRSQKLIENEKNTLTRLFSIWPVSFEIPTITQECTQVLSLDDLSVKGKRTLKLDDRHFSFLSEIAEKTSFKMNQSNLFSELDIRTKLSILKNNFDQRIPQGMVRKLDLLMASLDPTEIEVCLSHGDFTPWNCYVKQNKLAVYDWELSSPFMPVGFDAFHFIIQKGILIEKKSWKQITRELEHTISYAKFNSWLKFKSDTIGNYLKLYLLINTINYLTIYSQQKNWHLQIYWLLNTWNEALSDLLQDVKCHRELVLMDIFDFLKNKNYAAIKFPNALPDKLDAYSDVDMCIEKDDLSSICNYLSAHPLVQNAHQVQKSFMHTTHLTLKNGTFLSFDFIWKFKRKQLVFLNAETVLQRTITNSYGVKLMCMQDLIRYLALFYSLNNTKVPTKYLDLVNLLEGSYDALNQILYSNLFQSKVNRNNIVKALRRNSENKGLNALVENANYLLDTIKQLLLKKGFVITFSGVDGAGKSTVIEHTRMEIEKKLRRNVVVLRHRPSLFPILSAITKGKEASKREQESASKLPRQGNNKSKVSSLLRFAYYYIDYFLGQFYIYVKYTLRGTVVIYDRYYFDFIVDSKRSNILISQRLARFFYHFLLKPDLNFFLFADSSTILKRKKELDANTINELTQKYSGLFLDLDAASKAKGSQYMVIENVVLKETMAKIISSTLPLAA